MACLAKDPTFSSGQTENHLGRNWQIIDNQIYQRNQIFGLIDERDGSFEKGWKVVSYCWLHQQSWNNTVIFFIFHVREAINQCQPMEEKVEFIFFLLFWNSTINIMHDIWKSCF